VDDARRWRRAGSPLRRRLPGTLGRDPRHPRVEAALAQCDRHRVARSQARRPAHDAAVGGGDDRIAPCQHTARTHQLERRAGVHQPTGHRLQPAPQGCGERAAGAVEPRPPQRHVRGPQPARERRQPARALAAGPLARDRQAPGELIEPGDPLRPLQRRRAQQPRRVVEPLLPLLGMAPPGLYQAMPVTRQCGEPLEAVGHRPHRGTGRGRGPQVGHEVGDREVGLMPHPADHRDRAGGDRPGEALVVERPQILDRPAAPDQQQHVALGAGRGGGEGPDQLAGRLGALHRCGVQDDRHLRGAAREGRQHVAQRGRAGGRHDADSPRRRRGHPLATLLEQAFRLQLGLQSQELLEQVARPGLPHQFHVDLEVAPGLVQPHLGPDLHPVTVGRRERDVLVASPEHHRPHRGLRILEAEVPVPARRAGEVGDLPGNPQQREASLQQPSNRAVQLTDRDDIPRRCWIRPLGPHVQAAPRAEPIHKRRISVISAPNDPIVELLSRKCLFSFTI
jgi:hypothetical protein